MDKNDALRAMALQYEMQDGTPLAQRRAYSDVEDARSRYCDHHHPPPLNGIVTHGVPVPPPRLPSRPAGAPRLLLLFFCLMCVMTSATIGVVLTLLPLYDRLNSDGTYTRPKTEHRVVAAPTPRNHTHRETISTSIHTLSRRIEELDAEMERGG